VANNCSDGLLPFCISVTAEEYGFSLSHSYLSELYPEVDLDRDHLTIFMRYLGEQREAIRGYFNAFWNNDKRSVLFDISCITSMSKRMEVLPQVGYNNIKSFDPQLNIMFVTFGGAANAFILSHFTGNIRDVKAFSLSLKEFDKKAVTVITDKGFYSNKNLQEMQNEGITYIVPLRRNAPLINYSKLQQGNGYKNLDGYFEFEKRIFGIIHCKPIGVNSMYMLMIFSKQMNNVII
jgi:hypothetical protein